jgi:hypothetical protein
MKPTIGRIVHYILPEGHTIPGEHRPAMIVRVWTDTTVQLQVFTDGSNDDPKHSHEAPNVMWKTSVVLDETATTQGSWHWPERD